MHSEKRSNPAREAQLALFTGGIFGAVHTISGHPLDTIKSKMVINQEYLKLNAFETTAKIMRDEGARGFFRGMVPPLWGSTVYRGVMLSAYEFAYTKIELGTDDDHWAKQELGFTKMRPMVVAAALFAGMARSGLENPVEYAKVMGQTGKKWQISEIYRGTSSQVIRNTGLLIPIFGIVDIARRHSDYMQSKLGTFCVTSFASSMGYLMAWPLETLKNLAQTGLPHPGATVAQRMDYLGGFKGLYRGVWPGTICGGFRNGCGFMIMGYAQSWATQLGLRD